MASARGLDRRTLDKVGRRLQRLQKLCENPRLGLRNSPPYLPELVPDTLGHLRLVWGSRGAAAAASDEAEYLGLLLRHLLDKADRAVLLFKDGREKMFDENSSHRRNLTKLSLIFSHMLSELRSLFPGGHFQGDTYRLTKSDAAEFWRRAFGSRCVVPWSSFKQQLRQVHSFEEGMESMALKSTLDLTCNEHISIFEFDIFTLLFQPWSTLLRNWNHLAVTHPGYMAFLTYDQVKSRLEKYSNRPGSYIYRLSCTRMGQWAIGHVTEDGSIVQTIPHNTPLYQALVQGYREGVYLYPDGRDINPDLSCLCESVNKGRIKVTQEQYELYCEMGSSFQLCKICTERDKNVRIEPCGHLMCQPCLHAWQKSDSHSCPFCRCDIRGTELIAIDPFNPPSNGRAGQSAEQGDEDEDEDDEDDLEDVDQVMEELALMKKAGSISGSHPGCTTPTLPVRPPLLPPRPSAPDMSLQYGRDRDPHGVATLRERQQHSLSDMVFSHCQERSSSEDEDSGSSTPPQRGAGSSWDTLDPARAGHPGGRRAALQRGQGEVCGGAAEGGIRPEGGGQGPVHRCRRRGAGQRDSAVILCAGL
ncbi:E3 ubiquitin-protein ligase CBL-C isoform X2 [Lepisosteus oculatus]|uniref:E3 ubiquitin-protein ligase CBL-C isoform X2 n=1 Tax=Lepisosteus oculatus TaxID=7918 RepID=UPI003717BD78